MPHGGVTLAVHALGNEGGKFWRLGATLYRLKSTRHHCHTKYLHKGVWLPAETTPQYTKHYFTPFELAAKPIRSRTLHG